MNAQNLVSICICTCGRPGVTETVHSIFAQQGALSNIEIVVCDDDPTGSARQWIAALADHAPVPLKYVLCASRNISICRNTCLAESRGEWVAFIDDDEIAEPNWIAELLSTQTQYTADVVKGYVKGVYPTATPPWIIDGDPFTRDPGPSGRRPALLGTGNVMFRRNLVIDNNIWFDENLGRTGGEDTDFFRRLGECGAHMVACQTAIVNEITSPSRVQRNYLQRRYRRQGQVEAMYHWAHSSPTRRLTLIVKHSVHASKCAYYGFVLPKQNFEMFRSFWYSFGMLEYTLGRQPFAID